MRSFTLLFAILFAASSSAQTTLQQLERFNITNSPGEILNIIKQEIKKQDIQLPKSPVIRPIINSDRERQRYLQLFQQQLTRTVAANIQDDLMLSIPAKQLAAYANRGLDRFKTISGGMNVDALMAPALGSSLRGYAEDAIKTFYTSTEKNLKKLDTLAIDALLLLKKNGFDYINKTEKEITQQLNSLKNLIKPDSLKDMLLTQVKERALHLVKKRAADIKTMAADIQQKFNNDFNNALATVNKVADAALSDLGKSIEDLTKNETKVNNVIDQIQTEINNRKKEIDKIERDLHELAKNPAGRAAEIARTQAGHAKKIAQNVFQTNIINKYVKEGVQVIKNLEEYKQTADKIFSGEYLRTFKAQLENFKTPTLSGVVNFASNALDNIAAIDGVLDKLGIGKGAARKVAIFVKGANAAMGLVKALIPPNPLGILSALGNLGGLFGGGGPSIEEQMFEEMQKGFNQLNERLDVIEAKIDRLTDFVTAMYKDMMKSMQLLSADLQVIIQKQNLLAQMNSYQIYSTYNLVKAMIDEKPKNLSGLELYSIWFGNRENNYAALQALDEFISSPDNLRLAIAADFTSQTLPQSYQKLAEIEINAYDKTKDLYKVIYPGATNRERNLLLIPPAKNEFDLVLKGEEIAPDKFSFDFETATDKYINSIFLANLTNQYVELQPFFLISKRNAPRVFQPMETLDELFRDYETVRYKVAPSRTRFRNLLAFANFGIVQQSMMAGHTLTPFINNALLGDGTYYNESIEALKANELLRKNMCVYFINSTTDPADLNKVLALIEEARTDRSKIDELNTLLRYHQGKLRFSFSNNPADPLLYLALVNAAGENITLLPVPDISTIQNREFLYSDNYYLLMYSKEKIMDALIDLSFFEGLNNQQAAIYKQVFFKQHPK